MTVTPKASTATPRRRPKDRKQQIVAQARDLFVERGYPSVSMALIAERVGITAGALYRHFDNKQVLLEEVVRDSFSYLEEGVDQHDWVQAVDDGIDRAIGHPYVSDLWSNEVRHLPDVVRDDLRRRMRTWAHSFASPLRHHRPELDEWQTELVAWGVQSVLACLGSIALHVPSSARRPVVRAAALSLGEVQLLPAGELVPRHEQVISPASTRERLLQAAIVQFAERGFQETSMTSIGAAADVTGPNLYSYFESKADLARAVHERGMHTLWANVDTALRAARTPDDALERLVAGQVDLAQTWTADRTAWSLDPDISEATRTHQREYLMEWVTILRQIVPDIEVREARLRVLIALKLINDLPRTPSLASYTNFPADLGALALGILRDGAPQH